MNLQQYLRGSSDKERQPVCMKELSPIMIKKIIDKMESIQQIIQEDVEDDTDDTIYLFWIGCFFHF